MIDDKELIRCALLGSREAQALCTVKGIAIPCPLCGKEASVEILDCYTAEGLECESESFRKDTFKCICNHLKGGCGTSTGVSETKQETLEKWNTRPALPIGRCRDCFQYHSEGPGVGYCSLDDQGREETNFCSEFEPKEE